ncbi:hypothetical protein Pcinc_028644 [Petrolisthes cinctipes]|uniref:Uncharacterized protein n=1 Tax=Petrolisthes cinctipes TaxID=88211 RepID=A0AAE1F2G1_PETCI|nr:hypothetical protein Pcinc_028644 [Petrolisthes cinctipes]
MASSTAVPAATCEEVTGEPSVENPTKEYLNNLTKLQLQKRCRNIGLTNVWANKDQLVDKIMAHHRDGAPSSCNTPSSSEGSSVNSPSSEQVSSVSLNSEGDSVHPCSEPISAVYQCSERNSANSHGNNSTASNDSEESIVNHSRLECEIRKLYELFEIKNCEIKHTYEEIKKMNTCFHHLNARLARLEETVGGRRHSDSDPAITHINEFRNTASLITNLSHRICDLEKKVSENTQVGSTSDVRQSPQPDHESLIHKHLILDLVPQDYFVPWLNSAHLSMDTLTKKISGNISSHTTLEDYQTNKYRGHLATPLPPQYISRWTATGGEGLGHAEADQVTPTDPPPATIILPTIPPHTETTDGAAVT